MSHARRHSVLNIAQAEGARAALGRRVAPIVLVLTYAALGAGYIAVTPAWEAPDEPWHLAYAEALAAGAAPTTRNTYEAHQAPAYYAGLAIVLRLLGIAEVPRAVGNPYYPWAEAAYWHPPGAAEEGIVAALRTLSGFLASAAVAITWAVGRRLIPPDPGVAALAGATVALLPQYQHIGHSLNNDGAAALAGGALVYVGIRIAVAPWTRAPVAVAAAVALAFAAKATAWPILAALAVGIAAAAAAGTMSWRGAGRAVVGIVTAVAASVAILWWLSPGLPRAMWVDSWFRGASISSELVDWRFLGALARETLVSFWARFGWLSVDLPRATAVAAGAYAVVGAAGLLLLVRRGPRGAHVSRGLLVAGSAVAAASGAWAKNAVADPQPQGRLLFGAVAATAVLVACGWRFAWPPRARGVASAVMVTVLLCINLYAVTRTLPDAYRPWRTAPRPVATYILPQPAVVAARVRFRGEGVRQTFQAPMVPASVAVAVNRVVGSGTLQLTLRDADGSTVAMAASELSSLVGNRWLHLDVEPQGTLAGRPASDAPQLMVGYTLEIAMIQGDGEVHLWGAATDAYESGALTVDGERGTDLSLIVLARAPDRHGPASPERP